MSSPVAKGGEDPETKEEGKKEEGKPKEEPDLDPGELIVFRARVAE